MRKKLKISLQLLIGEIYKIKWKKNSVEYLKEIRKIPLSPRDVFRSCSSWLNNFISLKKYLPDNLDKNLIFQQITPSFDSRVLLKYKKNGIVNKTIIDKNTEIYIVEPGLMGTISTKLRFIQNNKIGFTLYKFFSGSTSQSDTGVWF